jgi:hypothetical protein
MARMLVVCLEVIVGTKKAEIARKKLKNVFVK